ncbi:AMID-like mitochondrial oxidoreductase [Aulographum hederae CBS 113979]|uniref:AMID-like mitochondrial oxidoreductase n=1 Tax=Aulographum hederae CBS 113979 TaxID=1176131 RepID=A0A6G1H8E8_9PEZI|nr:AMID-like mitochondrial oxidoreductase [Aulographum hederae CBS 113979]
MAAPTTHSIVIIGASFGGIPTAHGLLKDVLPAVAATTNTEYKVTMISSSEYFYWKVGAPRVIVNPASLPVEKALVPIPENFKVYGDKFEFVKATVTALDPSSKSVTTDTGASVHYDSLIIASGTSFSSPLWSVSAGSDKTKAALDDIHARLPEAKTVLVAGGGAAGVETAGELGQLYGGQKDITLLSGTKQLLNGLNNKAVGKDAEARLSKMKVTTVHDVRVETATTESNQTVLLLANGETKNVDIYIEATGDKPNSQFVPQEWLNERNYVKTDPGTLRLDVADVPGVYVFGSVGSYSNGSILDTKFALKPLLESIKLDLSGKEPGPRTKGIYKKVTSDMQFVPVGPTGGVGAVFGYKIPSFMVKMIKAKDFMIGQVPKLMDGTG